MTATVRDLLVGTQWEGAIGGGVDGVVDALVDMAVEHVASGKYAGPPWLEVASDAYDDDASPPVAPLDALCVFAFAHATWPGQRETWRLHTMDWTGVIDALRDSLLEDGNESDASDDSVGPIGLEDHGYPNRQSAAAG